MARASIVEYFGVPEGHRCGYCGQKDTKISHGMWVHTMTLSDYEMLLERGWRRSGKYCFKPLMEKCCCPMYMIRLPVEDFRMTRSQKRLLRRVHRYLSTGEKPWGGTDRATGAAAAGGATAADMEYSPAAPRADLSCTNNVSEPEKNPRGALCDKVARASTDGNTEEPPGGSTTAPERQQASVPKPGCGADPGRPRCGKARQRRLQRKREKIAAAAAARGEHIDPSEVQLSTRRPQQKTIEAYINAPMADPPAHTLELRLVVSAGDEEGREFRDTYSASHAVYSRYQVAVHGDAPHKVDAKQHRRFLVDSPLQEEAGRGSYHQQYWLDGRLIAVGVLDLLPRYVSSVYLYYDPDYSFLSLGTYAALREVALTRQLMREDPRMRYYGMGFYIQSCPKMRYKGNVRPAQLLCPQAYTWNPLAASVPKLDANKYSRLDDSDCEDAHGQVALASVGVLYKRTAMRYATYAVYSGGATDASEVSEYARLVGRPCAASMLLYRSDAAATRGSHDEEDDDSSDD